MKMDIDDLPPHQRVYILHVEDDPHQARMEQGVAGKTYVGRLREPIERALSAYAVEPEQIHWDLAESKETALRKLDQAESDRPGRGFDIVLCDLQIGEFEKKGLGRFHWQHGIDVVRKAANFKWPGPIVIITSFAGDDQVLAYKEAQLARVRFDDWLKREDLYLNPEMAVAKLRRHLVPVYQFVWLCQRLDPPSIFVHYLMRRLLRELVFLAYKDYSRWPLCRLLLLGEPGSGKGMISRTFHRLLSTKGQGVNRKFITQNCASVVAEAHGGRITFFGAEGFGGNVDDVPGIFERATRYSNDRDEHGLAQRKKDDDWTGPNEGGGIDYASAGVVFLDEFAELDPQLQASILNALEEGIIKREGSGEEVRIGCHVIFATNNFDAIRSPSGRGEARLDTRVREDLIDRIPYILEVPSLSKRIESQDGVEEVEALIKALAAQTLKHHQGASACPDVKISDSALNMIKNAIHEKVIKSTRQLQVIADVLSGEDIITDGNLAPLFAKAKVLGMEDRVRLPSAALSSEDKANVLGLPSDFKRDNLPLKTRETIDLLCRILRGECILDHAKKLIHADNDLEDRYILFSAIVGENHREKLYANKLTTLRTDRSAICKGRGIKTSNKRSEMKRFITKYLLGEREPMRDPSSEPPTWSHAGDADTS